jgi:hypothetical protein
MKKLKINTFVVASFLLMSNSLALAYFTFSCESDMVTLDYHEDDFVDQLHTLLQKEN